jgi:hypothetical protein
MAAHDIYRQGDRKAEEAFVEPGPVEEVPSPAKFRHAVNTITDQRDVAIIKMLIDRSGVLQPSLFMLAS